jgi:hypothetical protein
VLHNAADNIQSPNSSVLNEWSVLIIIMQIFASYCMISTAVKGVNEKLWELCGQCNWLV